MSMMLDPDNAACTDTSRFDLRPILRIRKWGGEQLLRRMAEVFQVEVPRRIAAGREAAAHGEWTLVLRTAHSLKSSCGQMGAVRMSAICAEVEVVAAGENPIQAASLFDVLRNELAAFVIWLDGITNNQPDTTS